MTVSLTPFSLSFLLHCHCSRDSFQDPPSKAMEECVIAFKKQGLIYQDGGLYLLTDYGTAYIEHILQAPLPTFTFD